MSPEMQLGLVTGVAIPAMYGVFAFIRGNARKRKEIADSVTALRDELVGRLAEVEKQLVKEDWHGESINELTESIKEVRKEAGVDRVKIAKVEAKQNGVK